MSLFSFKQRRFLSRDKSSGSEVRLRHKKGTMSHNISSDDLKAFDDSQFLKHDNLPALPEVRLSKEKVKAPLIKSAAKLHNKSISRLLSVGKYDRDPKSKDTLISLMNNQHSFVESKQPVHFSEPVLLETPSWEQRTEVSNRRTQKTKRIAHSK